jgi:ATP-dependent Clp protease ATP-binding subunit ClpA
VFERFTEPARRLVVFAQQESRVLQHDYVGTEHLLIGATQVDDQLTAALAELGITTEAARAQVTRMVGPTGAEREGPAAFTAEATEALERARPEALQLGHDYVAPAHVVLGLLATHDGTMPVLLTRLGVSADTVRLRVLSLLDGVRPVRAAEPAATFSPLCPRCAAPLDGNIHLVTMDAGADRVRLACCASCGAVLPALPAP